MAVSAAGQTTIRSLFIAFFLVIAIFTLVVADVLQGANNLSWVIGEVFSLLRGDLLLFGLGMLAYLLHSLMETNAPFKGGVLL